MLQYKWLLVDTIKVRTSAQATWDRNFLGEIQLEHYIIGQQHSYSILCPFFLSLVVASMVQKWAFKNSNKAAPFHSELFCLVLPCLDKTLHYAPHLVVYFSLGGENIRAKILQQWLRHTLRQYPFLWGPIFVCNCCFMKVKPINLNITFTLTITTLIWTLTNTTLTNT